MKINKLFFCCVMFYLLSLSFQIHAEENIKMSRVRELAKLSVNKILQKSPIDVVSLENYWNYVHGRTKPLVVFFYSNKDGRSQRLATLIRYLAPIYHTKLSFARVMVINKGVPSKGAANNLKLMYSLDKTPGILYYDNVGTEMVLEDEDYIDADFKEFRTPSMLFWKKYYLAVRQELDDLLAD